MKKNKIIVFVTRGYPTKTNSSFAFLQPIIRGIADEGVRCIVIAPQSVNGKSRQEKRPIKWFDTTGDGNQIEILQPRYIALPGSKINGIQMNIWGREFVVKKSLEKLKERPDIVYAHFWDCAMISAKYCLENQVPLIAVTGESTINMERFYDRSKLEERLTAVKGVISVSTKNKLESEKKGLIKDDCKVIISPNAIDTSLFYRSDKRRAKEKLGLSEDDFVISYVGRFSERKGVNRLISAVRPIEGAKLILIGYGGELEESNQIVVAKRVAHENVVEYLNASDVYCLPTQAEGCCNSIVEAMACGLPIVSSDRDFNDDILTSRNSIRINPDEISEITEALKKLKEQHDVRVYLAENAYVDAKNMTINNRVKTIIRFIEEIVDA